MKKIVMFFTFFLVCMPFVVNAEICSTSVYNNLKREAYKAQFSYELKFDENDNYYFEITVTNLNKKVLFIYADSVYEGNDDNLPIKINSTFEGGKTYEFKLYGGYYTPCTEEYLYTKKVSMPKYNKYSKYEECIEYEEFPLCNKWYQGDIPDEEYFFEKLEEYKKTLVKPDEPIVVAEKSFWDKVIEFYNENKVLSISVISIVSLSIVSLIVVKVVRRKKRVKIGIDV